MIKIIYKNLEKSELLKNSIHDRIEPIISKFLKLKRHKVDVTLSMLNSPTQYGPDLFSVKVLISGKLLNNLIIEKTSSSMYIALADVCDHMLEILNRENDKKRVKARNQARNLLSSLSRNLAKE